jgi:TolB-like protein
MAAMTVQAQKFIVLDFEQGSKIDAEEAEYIFHDFITNFHPTGYHEIDREKVNATISELGFPANGLTNQQLTKLGRTLEATYIVVGSMRENLGEYSVDVQVVDISTGTTIANAGNTFKKTKYRNKVSKLAKKLAGKIK